MGHKNYCMGISSYIQQSWLDLQHQNICFSGIDSTRALSPAYIPWLNVPQLPGFSLAWTARGGCVIGQQRLLLVNRCDNWAFSLVVSQSSQKEKSTRERTLAIVAPVTSTLPGLHFFSQEDSYTLWKGGKMINKSKESQSPFVFLKRNTMSMITTNFSEKRRLVLPFIPLMAST